MTEIGATTVMVDPRVLFVHEKYEGVQASEDGMEIYCAPEHEQFVRMWMKEPGCIKDLKEIGELLGIRKRK